MRRAIISAFHAIQIFRLSAANEAPLEILASSRGEPGIRRPAMRNRLRAAAAVLPAIVALALGTVASYLLGSSRIDPDVIEYQALARNLTLQGILNGEREPIWPMMYYLPVHILGDQSWIAVRGIGVLGFVFMVIVFQALCSSLFGRIWGIGGALVLAASPWMVYQGTRGLREQTAAALVLLLCLALVQPSLTNKRFVALFALAGVAGLLRSDAMDVMLGALFVALLIRRPPLTVWLAGPATVVLLIGPLLIANYVETGDPFYHTNVLARFFRNIEFAGQPGFITPDEMKLNSFAGAPVTWMQYVFGMHTPAELVRRALFAYAIVPTHLAHLVLFFSVQALFPSQAIPFLDVFEITVVAVVVFAAVVGG